MKIENPVIMSGITNTEVTAVTSPSTLPSTVEVSAFSNPLYYKTPLIPFLASWPIAVMCLTVYFYNLINFKNMSLTLKMIFFPILLFPGIIDNCYDLITNADIAKYKEAPLAALIGVFVLAALTSLIFLVMYVYEQSHFSFWCSSTKAMYKRLINRDDAEDARGGEEEEEEEEEDDEDQQRHMGRWQRIIDEYMTANLIWGLTMYNLMLMIVYVARFITYQDKNFMRETDVAIVTAVTAVLIKIMIGIDFWLFNNPASGSAFMHYYIATIFTLNFTLDFHAQVGFCEYFTLVVCLTCAFLVVYKLWAFALLGTSASKKND